MKKLKVSAIVCSVIVIAVSSVFSACSVKPCEVHQGEWVVAREATCTAEGELHFKCEKCEYEATRVIDKLPHDYELVEYTESDIANVCSVAHYRCSVCGKETQENVISHHYEYLYTDLTDSDHGSDRFECVQCHKKDFSNTPASSATVSLFKDGREYTYNVIQDLFESDSEHVEEGKDLFRPCAKSPLDGFTVQYLPDGSCVEVKAESSFERIETVGVNLRIATERGFSAPSAEVVSDQEVVLVGQGMEIGSVSAKNVRLAKNATISLSDGKQGLSATVQTQGLYLLQGSSLSVRQKNSPSGIYVSTVSAVEASLVVSGYSIGIDGMTYMYCRRSTLTLTGDGAEDSIGMRMGKNGSTEFSSGTEIVISDVAVGVDCQIGGNVALMVRSNNKLTVSATRSAIAANVSFMSGTNVLAGDDKSNAHLVRDIDITDSVKYIYCYGSAEEFNTQ